MLSPHGHVEHHFASPRPAGTTWLDTEPGGPPGLLAYLESMRFLLRVEPRDATAELAVLSAGRAGGTPAVLAGAGLPVPDRPCGGASRWTAAASPAGCPGAPGRRRPAGAARLAGRRSPSG